MSEALESIGRPGECSDRDAERPARPPTGQGFRTFFLAFVAACLEAGGCAAPKHSGTTPPGPSSDGARRLFNGRTLDGFYSWLADSGRDDPRGVFTVTNGMIRVSGEGLGYLSTTQSHSNYHLAVEYRWGTRNWHWGDRVGKARDSGVFLHSFGPDGNSHDGRGAFKAAIECNVFQGATGDFLLIRGSNRDGTLLAPRLTVMAGEGRDADGWPTWTPDGKPVTLEAWGRVNWREKDAAWKDVTDFRGGRDLESSAEDWTRLECRCHADTITIWVNGIKVNEARQVYPTAGPILLQCEGSEIYFRTMELRPLESSANTGGN